MTSINIRIQNGPKPLRGGRNQIFQNPDIAKKGGGGGLTHCSHMQWGPKSVVWTY